MKKFYWLLLVLISIQKLNTKVTATDNMQWNTGTWNIYDSVGGYSGAANMAPTLTKNDWVFSGVTISIAAATYNNLSMPATLSPNTAITVS